MSIPRLLALSAVAMVVGHWLRLLPLGYAAPVPASRWEDFADLLLPYAVLAPALLVLDRLGAGRRTWTLALLGAIVFTQGHGLHLSANAISYASGPAEPAYLWDEQVGHHLWFTGLTLVLVVVVEALRPVPLRTGATAILLAALVGVSWTASLVEAGAVPFGACISAGLTVYGWRLRGGTGRLLVLSYGLSLVLTAVYGVLQGGFPQPSELGWL